MKTKINGGLSMFSKRMMKAERFKVAITDIESENKVI
jgi:hypothetical protein